MEINILQRYLMGCEAPDGPKASVVLSFFMFIPVLSGLSPGRQTASE